MKCKKCGHDIKESDLYCDYCGEAVNDVNNYGIGKKKIFLIILMELILLFVLLGLLVFFISGFGNKLNLDKFNKVLSNKGYEIKNYTNQNGSPSYIEHYYAGNEDESANYNYVIVKDKSKIDSIYDAFMRNISNNMDNDYYQKVNLRYGGYKYFSIEQRNNVNIIVGMDNTIFYAYGTKKIEIKDVIKSLDLSYKIQTFLITAAIVLLIIAIYIFVMWRIFVKAGKKGWYSLIPIFSEYHKSEIAFKNGWLFILLLISPVNIVMIPIWLYKTAKAFGKSTAFAICNIFFPYINMQIIALDDSEYILVEH